MRTTAITVLVSALLALAAVTARADGRTIAVVNLEISGDGAPELLAQLAASVERGVTAAGSTPIALEAIHARFSGSPELVSCSSSECHRRIGDAFDAKEFIRGRVVVTGASYAVTLELHSMDQLARKLDRNCNVCTITELNGLLERTTAELLGDKVVSQLRVVIATSPAGAEVRVDGVAVGESPVEVNMTPGQHVVTARKDGYVSEQKSITIEADGDEHRFDLLLSPVGGVAPVGGDDRQYRTLKWIAAGGAAAAILTGVTLIVLDGAETCDQSSGMRCPSVRSTKTAGFVSLGLGAALGGVATWMFLRDKKAAERRTAIIAPTRGGAIAGVSVQF